MSKNEAPEPDLKADIKKHFWNEYFDAAKAAKTGFKGKVARMPEPLRAGLGFVALGGLLASSVVMAATIIPAIVAVAASAALIGTWATAQFSVISDAEKKVSRDIENGTLVTRYQIEVLDQKSQALSELKSQLTEKTAAPRFAAAARKTARAEKSPARKHHIRLHKNTQPA